MDVLISNAGQSQRRHFEKINLKEDRALFDVNVFGLVNLARIVVKRWFDLKQPGQLLVTSSAAGKIGAPYSASYTASKHALHVSVGQLPRAKLALSGARLRSISH